VADVYGQAYIHSFLAAIAIIYRTSLHLYCILLRLNSRFVRAADASVCCHQQQHQNHIFAQQVRMYYGSGTVDRTASGQPADAYAAVDGYSGCRADRDKTHGFYAINIVLAKLNSCRIDCLLCTKAEANVTKQTGISPNHYRHIFYNSRCVLPLLSVDEC